MKRVGWILIGIMLIGLMAGFAQGETRTIIAAWREVSAEASEGSGTLRNSHAAWDNQNGSWSVRGMREGDYWEFEFSSKGYEDIELRFETRGSLGGAKYWKVEYSTDGESYEEKCRYEVGTDFELQVIEFGAELNDSEKAYIRLTVAGSEGINREVITVEGSNRIAGMEISGKGGAVSETPKPPVDETPEPPVEGTPTPSPDEWEAIVGAEVEIEEEWEIRYGATEHGRIEVRRGSESGELIASGEKVRTGTLVYIVSEAEAGYHLEWIKANGEVLEGNSLVISEETELEAKFSPKGSVNCVIRWNEGTGYEAIVKYGSVQVMNGGTVPSGTTIEIEIKLESGYELMRLRVGEKDIEDAGQGYRYEVTGNTEIEIVVMKITGSSYEYEIPGELMFGKIDLNSAEVAVSYTVRVTSMGGSRNVYITVNKTNGTLRDSGGNGYEIPYTIEGSFVFSAPGEQNGSLKLQTSDILKLNLPAGNYSFTDSIIFFITAD
ncbi:MAG: hypothetical protein Q4C04_01765 [Clostridia bacterium]|nr:hypothetical protein [Clostridia bacterium]